LSLELYIRLVYIIFSWKYCNRYWCLPF